MVDIRLIHQVGVVKAPEFIAEDMQELAATALGLESARLAKAVNVFDEAARPLSRAYAKQKAKAGEQTIRNYHLTGEMMATREVIDAESGLATVGFTDSLQRAKAAQVEKYESMLGASPADRVALHDKAFEILGRNLNAMKAA